MIRTKLSITHIPTAWAFEYYCNLTEKLWGQEIKISSVFNTEKTPSMCIYIKEDETYWFKDFSSGKSGDIINLVQYLFNLRYDKARYKILEDFKNRKQNYEKPSFSKHEKFKVVSHVTRGWNQDDADYWLEFNIGSSLLNKYNVKPLSEYIMTKKDSEGVSREMLVKGGYLYGYFKNNGELYKIYQPKRISCKFISLSNYIQGSEQLEYKQPILVICSSLKDMMTLDSFKLNIECIAPTSEGTLIPRSMLAACSIQYDKIATLLDNDDAGTKAMQIYTDTFGIPGLYLKLSKDLSDSVKNFGLMKTKKYLKPLIETI